MGFFDALFGRKKQEQQPLPPYRAPAAQPSHTPRMTMGLGQQPGQLNDEQALARYRYMVQSAPPEQIEQAHQEAFEKLTPEQRGMVLREMSQQLPASETAHIQANQADSRTLARIATRAEMRNPGYMERTFGPGSNYQQQHGPMGGGMGGGMMGTIFGSMVAGFVGSMAAMTLFDALDGGLVDMPMEDPMADMGGEEMMGDMGGDFGGDFGGGDMGGGWDSEM
jgi:hypothetical protein